MPTRRLTDYQFRALLDLWMCSDPWPITNDTNEAHTILEDLLNEESEAAGYSDWVHAFHEFKPERPLEAA